LERANVGRIVSQFVALLDAALLLFGLDRAAGILALGPSDSVQDSSVVFGVAMW
jgi:hypothetical protein